MAKRNNYKKVSGKAVETERSICGFRRRLLKKDDGVPASLTCLKTHEATAHWHRKTHEYYYVIEGAGLLVVDGENVPVEAGDCVWIKPGAFHHAEGDLTSLIIGVPPFDPADVLFDPPPVMRGTPPPEGNPT